MKNLAHSASLDSVDKNAPSNAGTKHLPLAEDVSQRRVSGKRARAPRGWDSQGDVHDFIALQTLERIRQSVARSISLDMNPAHGEVHGTIVPAFCWVDHFISPWFRSSTTIHG
jgi:hypothetical protein